MTTKKGTGKKTPSAGGSKKTGKSRPAKKNVSQRDTAKKKNHTLSNTSHITDDPYALARGDRAMSVVDHLEELRSRLLVCLAVIFILTCVALYFSEILLNFIMAPYVTVTQKKLTIITFQGPIMVRIKISIICALNLSIPVILFQAWRFIMPAIDKGQRMFSRFALFFAIILFYTGIIFIFAVLFPFTIKMLSELIPHNAEPMTSIDSYLNFLFMFSLTTGLIFELPIVVLILSKLGIITPQFLIVKRKYSIVFIWIIAAIITPADVLTQVAVAVPLMLLYEISILIAKIMYNKKKKKTA